MFLYFFRDFDKDTLDVGLEFTTISPMRDGKILCRATTANIKGLAHRSFLVDASTRSILGLPGRHICYWINGKNYERIYDRVYRKMGNGKYVHASRNAKSQFLYDLEGLEKRARNIVSRPRRYQEKFVRLLRI